MNHDDWNKEVRKKLIDLDESVSEFAIGIGFSPEWVRQTLYGRNIRPQIVKIISEKLGIENYLEGEKNEDLEGYSDDAVRTDVGMGPGVGHPGRAHRQGDGENAVHSHRG